MIALRVNFFYILRRTAWMAELADALDLGSSARKGVRVRVPLRAQDSAPVAQLDRASDFGSEGWGFDSLRACKGYIEL